MGPENLNAHFILSSSLGENGFGRGGKVLFLLNTSCLIGREGKLADFGLRLGTLGTLGTLSLELVSGGLRVESENMVETTENSDED